MSGSVPSSIRLADLGWDDTWAATLATAQQLHGQADPARVARVDLGACTVLGTAGSARVLVAPGTTVTVGDWVLVRQSAVVGALPRRTAIVRRAAGLDARAQALAANVDTVLVLVAADGRVTPRSIERYVTLVWESGATPVVVLTKADLAAVGALDETVERLEPACIGIDLHVISATEETGLDGLAPYFRRGRTVALLGSSGAGKSTLANHLAGTPVLATGVVREGDRRGRHTTTHRELVLLPGGGVLIDSPGLREVGLWSDGGGGDGVARTFPEITALVDQCRFADCTHRREPGCAVLAALADGLITDGRLASWRKLSRELDRLAA
ncbi:MAG: ribosome small subunit-dependent GTPase A, partial [Actinobacteria bacterium]|nr:ribosome small subunit-dependent GTPase A [Actinomycetota bacterium]